MTAPNPNQRKASSRQRPTSRVVLRAPITVALSQQQHQRAISALAALLSQWWDTYGRHLAAVDRHDPDRPEHRD
jgi:hypothetical protein